MHSLRTVSPPVDRPRTLVDLISHALATPRERAFEERLPGHAWERTSTQRLGERIDAIGVALRGAGIAPGDRVGIIAENSVDWLVCGYGIVCGGAVSVPMYATLAPDQLRFIIGDADIRLLFAQTRAQADRVHALCSSDVRVVILEDDGEASLRAFERRGAAAAVAHSADLQAVRNAIGPGDLAVLMYTSGTTGDPKGVMLTHGNIASNVADAFDPVRHELRPGDVAFSVLPFAHVFEHTNALGFLYLGLTHVVSHPDRLVDDIREARPHIVAFVPRILERVLSAVHARAAAEGGLRARLIPWALRLAREHARAHADGRSPGAAGALRYAVARALVLRKLKAKLGLDRISHVVSGSAPLQRDTALTFAGLGVPICEGYGLTETSPVVSVNRLGSIRYGTVGRPIPNVDVRITEDGEILVRGPNVMRGYYRHDEADSLVEGWFHTGDVGQLDSDGYLSILDRKNELFKTGGGKWISPARLEAAIKTSPYVGQAVVVGSGRAYPAALIAPAWDVVRHEFGLPGDCITQAISADERVRSHIVAEVCRTTAELGSHERVRCVALLPRDLSLDDGELSPTLKTKRRIVEARYAGLIEAAYAEPAPTVGG